MPSARAAATAASTFPTLNAPRSRDRIASPPTVNAIPSGVTATSSPRTSAPGPTPNVVAAIPMAIGQPPPGRVVGVHHRPAGELGGEEPRLRLEVGLHVPVEIQVVLRQVGEDRHVEHDAVDPMLVEGVRRDLQGRRLHALISHPCQQPVEVGRLRRGPRDAEPAGRRCWPPWSPRRPAVRPAARKIDARMYVTVVLPFVPVTPTVAIDAAGSPNATDDMGPIARRTDGTSACGASTSSHRSTTSAAAPASSAWGANACPSACCPGTQKKSAPDETSCESNATSVRGTAASPRIVAPGTVATRSANDTGGKAGVTASELTRAPVRGSVEVMVVRARGVVARRGAPSGCPDAGSRTERPVGRAGRRRRRRRRWPARRGWRRPRCAGSRPAGTR